MTTCKQCREFEKCKDDAFINGAKFDPDCSVKYCTGFEPMTNADRIRAMSDEELAKALAWECMERESCYGCFAYKNNGECPAENASAWEEWLKQPAEVE